MSDTVFVLGAGFSKPAEVPVQNEIMTSISPAIADKQYYKDVQRLYKKLFHLSQNDQIVKIPLEDVFTFLDRAISTREDTNTLHLDEMIKSQASIRKLIAMIVNDKLKAFAGKKEYVQKRKAYEGFFRELIEKRLIDQRDDPFSVISLNWDTIPEYFISRLCKDAHEDVKVDYTCYDYDYDDDVDNPRHIPSISLRQLNQYNMKIHKLHGSLNWGHCSSCGRLFVRHSVKSPPIFYETHELVCRRCTQTELKRLIITPTFMKDLNNTHLKMIWHSALLDLQEAKRIVFCGYAFPVADFELRYIMTKAIAGSKEPNKKKIRAIIYPPDDLLKKAPARDHERMKWERNKQVERYHSFFGQLDFDKKFMDAIDFMQRPDLIWDW